MPPAARGAGKAVLSEKFRFPGFVAYVHGSEVTSLNFKFMVNRLGFIRGSVVKVLSRNKGSATTVLTDIEKVCYLRGRLIGEFQHKAGRLRSWIQLRSSNGGVVSGRVRLGRRGGTFFAQTKTPGLFGLEATATKISSLTFVRFLAFPTPVSDPFSPL